MKIYKIIPVFLLLAMVSCVDYLDKNPESDLLEEQIYSDYERFKGVVDRANNLLHNYLYAQFDYGNEIGTYSDEQQQASTTWGYGQTVLNEVNTGNWQNTSAPGFAWRIGIWDDKDEGLVDGEFHYRKWRIEVPGECAVGLRTVNIAIQNIDMLEKFPQEGVYSQKELREQLLGQSYFLRAWFYFMLIRDFGAMPNMQKPYATSHNFDEIRPEYWESSEWAVQDLDSAIKHLPERWLLSTDKGRVTKTSARALKAMVLLYQASPNMVIPRSQSLSFNGTPEYDIPTATRAVEAGVLALESALSDNTRYRMYTTDEYSDAFFVKIATNRYISDEAIFQAPQPRNSLQTGFGFGGNQTGTGFYLPWFDSIHDWCGYSVPTQNSVDWFETLDGWDINDAVAQGSSWNPQDPYTNRDPRLKKFIFCHGDQMYLSTSVPTKMSGYDLGLTLDAREGHGHQAKEESKNYNFTGYYHAGKFRWPGGNQYDVAFDNNGYAHIWSFIRFAQLYLDLAEAANEVYGPTGAIPGGAAVGAPTAVEAINVVRRRVGMPDVKAIYYADAATFRDYIYKERARELFTEQHRWWDIRRWRIAKEVLSEGIYVADIQDDGSGNLTYGKKLAPDMVRVFENKHYWYPFHNDDMYLFENFEQNPGW